MVSTEEDADVVTEAAVAFDQFDDGIEDISGDSDLAGATARGLTAAQGVPAALAAISSSITGEWDARASG